MAITPLRSAIVVIGILLAGCGGGSSGPPAAVRPLAVQAVAAVQQATITPANTVPLLGDLDGDERCGVGDAIKILRIVVGLDDDTPVADANQNCSTDVGDAIKLLRYVVGLEEWPFEWQKTWVSGEVKEYIDEQTTPALEGVQVTIGGRSGNTDSNGQFTIKCVPVGDQTIAVSKSGYVTVDSLPATVSVQPATTELSTIYMIGPGSMPPPPPPPV